jgi:molybdenum cofactor synthesis domain-containing protein
VAVATLSDRVSRGEAEDTSGPEIVRQLAALGAKTDGPDVLPDDRAQLAEWLREKSSRASLIITTGGTGLGPRDVTPEAVADVADRVVPGIGERLRAASGESNHRAWLSRSVAAMRGSTLIVALPGSLRAVRECLPILCDLLPHALDIAQGGGHAAT